MIGGLVSPYARIDSFLIYLKCENCGHSFRKLYKFDELALANETEKYHQGKCEECGQKDQFFPEHETAFTFLDGDQDDD